jgi:lipopolysaccharide/colanic/teichoic acid biosynthesis glycosyltransferase
MLREPRPVARVAVPIQRRKHPGWKRGLDLAGVLLATPLVAPLLLMAAVYIRLVSPGPIFFVQSRVGFGGEKFRIFKLRTMHVPKISRDESHRDYVANRAGGDEVLCKPNYHSELIPGGYWLRKWSIDELPQLVNVLLGDMSLVGPRPDVLQLEDYEAWQLRRFEVLPGMTGLWQVSGKNRLTFDQMVALDIEYIDTMSVLRDVTIMGKTVLVLLNSNE